MVLVLLGKKILAGIPHTSVLPLLLLLIYINDFPHDILAICKVFADDTLLVSKIKDSTLSLSDLNYELEAINQ